MPPRRPRRRRGALRILEKRTPEQKERARQVSQFARGTARAIGRAATFPERKRQERIAAAQPQPTQLQQQQTAAIETAGLEVGRVGEPQTREEALARETALEEAGLLAARRPPTVAEPETRKPQTKEEALARERELEEAGLLVPPAQREGTQVFRDERGRLIGFTDPRTGVPIAPITSEDVETAVGGFQQKLGTPSGAVEVAEVGGVGAVGAVGQGELSLAERVQIAQQIGVSPELLNQIAIRNPDYVTALKAGLGAAAAGVVGGATVGAIAGGGVGAIGLGVVGGVGSFLAGARGELKSQVSGEISASTLSVRKAETLLRMIITDTNKNPQNAYQNYEDFNTILAQVDIAHETLKLETQRDINKFIGLGNAGTSELERFETFNTLVRPRFEFEMQTALVNPDPNKNLVSFNDLAGETL